MGEVKLVVFVLRSEISRQDHRPRLQLGHAADAADRHEAGISAARKVQLVLRRLVRVGPGSMLVLINF